MQLIKSILSTDFNCQLNWNFTLKKFAIFIRNQKPQQKYHALGLKLWNFAFWVLEVPKNRVGKSVNPEQ